MLKRFPISTLPLLLSWLLLCASAPLEAADRVEEESLLKAAFVFNFAKYVHWPEGMRKDKVIHLCLAGDDNIFGALKRLQGERVRGADVIIHPIDETLPAAGCDILFLGVSERHRLHLLLDPLGTRPILTISDIPRFAELGGIISLYWEGKKVRFAINLQAARRAGLRISSRLLNLARIVEETDKSATVE